MSNQSNDRPAGELIAEDFSGMSELPPTWPTGSFDARDWAKAFCRIAAKKGLVIDEDWMIGWFANALMCGYDFRQPRIDALEEEIRRLKGD